MPAPSDSESGYTPSEKEVAQNPRMLAMDAIKVVREEDDEQTGGDDTASQLALQSGGENAPRVLTDGLDKTMVTVKVDGVEQQVSVADMQRNYQRDAAAQTRLNEATRILEEARRTAAAAPKPPASVEQIDEPKDTTVHSSAESLGEFVDTLFEGDKDKAVAALAKLVTGRTPESPTLDLGQLAAQLTPEIRQQLIDDSALERFEKDNADLAADPHLVRVTNGFIQEEVTGGKPYAEALGTAAQRTRDWLTAIGAAKPTPEPTRSAHQPSKLERKGGIDEIQTLNRTASTMQDAPQTTSQTIAEMKKARGQEA